MPVLMTLHGWDPIRQPLRDWLTGRLVRDYPFLKTRTASANLAGRLIDSGRIAAILDGLDGRVDETNPYASNWIRVAGDAMFAPLNVLEVVESRWGGHNPHVTEANVRSLDLANGGGYLGRLSGAPPAFRTVGQYEAGRAPLLADNPGGTTSTSRLGGFFRRAFFRR